MKLAEHITEWYGERCPDFKPECIVCVAWKAHDELLARKPELSDDEIHMAMHWIDRYAAGIDGYPQLDRIAPKPPQDGAGREALATEFNQVGMTLNFFASAIKSGDQWTATCQREFDHAHACLKQLRASLAPVKDGWKLVPVEPTEAMASAGYAEWNRLRAADATLIYRAMLAASPLPVEGKGERS